MQKRYDQLFFKENNFAWKNEIDQYGETLHSPSLYPLTTYTNSIRSKINNTHIATKLNSYFCDKLITPYLDSDCSIFHRSSSIFTTQPNFKKGKASFFYENSSETFQHLIELGSIITCSDLKTRYRKLFVEAESFLFNNSKNKGESML